MDNLFFYASKLLRPLLQPDAWLILLLVLVLVLIRFNVLRWAQRLLASLVILLLLVAFLPVWAWLVAPLEHRFAANPPLPARIDGIIVLGGFLDADGSDYWKQLELTDGVERGVAFAELARRFPDAKVVMTGGSGLILGPGAREADYIPRLMSTLGVDSSRLLLERESRNTFENAVNSRALVQPKPSENWILVTSAMHMPRSVGIFCQQGWPVIPWPVDHMWTPVSNEWNFNLTLNVLLLDNALHEWFGLVAYRMSGKTNALFPSVCENAP